MNENKEQQSEDQVVNNINLFTVDDMLNLFNNKHLKALVAAWIDIEVCKNLKPEEIVGYKIMPTPPGQMPSQVKLTAKEQLKIRQEDYELNREVLDAIAVVRQEYAKSKQLKKLFSNA